jgi:two-component system, OmpR family, response regulator TrcR
MEKIKILLVEDEPSLARVVKDSLEQIGYSVFHAMDGEKAFTVFLNNKIDLCISDVMLPKMDGFSLVKRIRAQSPGLPILFLTARTNTTDVIEGYESGGNDYLKKPFSLEELFLRVKELLKRNSPINKKELRLNIGRYVFVPHRQTLQFENEEEIKLSHREAQLLQLLQQYKNEVLERKHALISVWGDDSFFNARSMDVFITKLRKHLSKDKKIEIVNIRGVGFKLIADDGF